VRCDGVSAVAQSFVLYSAIRAAVYLRASLLRAGWRRIHGQHELFVDALAIAAIPI
jgi:hypothetical protein